MAIDPEAISMEELRTLANENMEDEPATEQLEAATDDDSQDEIVYRREIDLGDGSGKQVFEAESPEALIDALVKAQEHATRKIRELSASQKSKEPAAPKYNDTDKFLAGQRFQQDPYEATDEIFAKTKAGEALAELREKVEKFERKEREAQSAQAFVKNHPEYKAIPANGDKIERYLQVYNLEGTQENLERAFNELKESGLLALNTEEDTLEQKTEQASKATTSPSRIERPTAPAAKPQTRTSSGLSARNSARSAPKAELTEDELYAMPLTQLEQLANRQLRGEAE